MSTERSQEINILHEAYLELFEIMERQKDIISKLVLGGIEKENLINELMGGQVPGNRIKAWRRACDDA